MKKTHAKRELDILLKTTPDAIVRPFVPEILAMCWAFDNSGQSGGSAPYVASALAEAIKKLCLHQTIAPLTGEDDEWICNHMDDNTCQNNRESRVFKDSKNGKSYFLDAIVWSGEEQHDTFTGKLFGISSRQYIKSFPFIPKIFYIDVVKDYDWQKYPENEVYDIGKNNKYAYQLKDPKQLDAVWNYYDRFD